MGTGVLDPVAKSVVVGELRGNCAEPANRLEHVAPKRHGLAKTSLQTAEPRLDDRRRREAVGQISRAEARGKPWSGRSGIKAGDRADPDIAATWTSVPNPQRRETVINDIGIECVTNEKEYPTGAMP